MKPITKRQIRIAATYGLSAILLMVAAVVYAEAPPFLAWAVFAVAFIAMEWNAVEVNDRMLQSNGSMVLLTAGTLFALRPDGSAFFAMVAMAALGSVVPEDIQRRQWFQPIGNFGQMVVSAAAAGYILDTFISGASGSTPQLLLWVVLACAAATAAYTVCNVAMVRYAVRYVYGQRNLTPWSGLHVLLPAQITLGVVGGLLGAGFHIIGKSAVVVLILGVYVLAHLSFASYAQLREAHQSAIRGFVKVLEARDMYTRGHTERVAYFSQLIGEQLRYTGTQLERLRWAALIHDLGKLAIPGHLLTKRGELEPEEFEAMRSAAKSVEEILGEVDFLEPMVSISGVHYLDLESFDPEHWSLDASIVAAADAFDAMTSTRSYRMAMSQTDALVELRKDTSGRYEPDVVDALEAALERTGEVYGAAVDVPPPVPEASRA